LVSLFTTPPLPSDWIAPEELLFYLNLFAGRLYLPSYSEYVRTCDFLGLLPSLDASLPPGASVGSDGFLGKYAKSECPFRLLDESPVPFFRQLLQEIRRDGQDIRRTDMGRILAGEMLTERDFRGRDRIYQPPEDLQIRRELWMARNLKPPLVSFHSRILKELDDVFESDQPAFPIPKHVTTSTKRRDTATLPDTDAVDDVYRSTGSPALDRGELDHRSGKGDEKKSLHADENAHIDLLVRHKRDGPSDSKACRRCGCSLCHTSPDARVDDSSNGSTKSKSFRWTISIKTLRKSANNCASCKMLYQTVSHMRGRSKRSAASIELEYVLDPKQMLVRQVDPAGNWSVPYEIYTTPKEAHVERK
jgi:hypothetical protein